MRILFADSAYTERYMSVPTSKQTLSNYFKSSLLNKALNISGKKFLLVHGSADGMFCHLKSTQVYLSICFLLLTDNVHMAQSMLLMKLLSRNGISFQTQIYPDENHSLAGVSRHLYQKLGDFVSKCFNLDVYYDDVGLRRGRRVRKG